MKIVQTILVFFILAGSALFFVSAKEDNSLTVSFLDVGQGDATLIRTPGNKNILVDGGPGNEVIEILEKELAWYDRTIDLMILTHPHDDHVSGLNAVLDRYDVREVLYTGVSHTAPSYLAWLKKLRDKNITVHLLTGKQSIKLDETVGLEIIWPQADLAGQIASNLNNTSIVAKLIHGNNTFLLSGDMEEEVETDLIKRGADLQAQILKVGHHGSDTSSSQDLIKAVNPEYAVMSLGENNKFGFPSLRVMRRFQKENIKILRTDKQGTITFLSNGQDLIYQP